MTSAAKNSGLRAPAPAAAVDDATSLLPSRATLLERLDASLPFAGAQPLTLFVLGLVGRDDQLTVTQSTLVSVTSLLARSLRHDDWLGSHGPAEFAVLLRGRETAAKTAAQRLVRAVADLDIPGLFAVAGVAAVSRDLTADEVFHRATISLTSARQVGPGTVIRYREPLV